MFHQILLLFLELIYLRAIFCDGAFREVIVCHFDIILVELEELISSLWKQSLEGIFHCLFFRSEEHLNLDCLA